VVALGITTDGVKVPLGLWDGSTENTTVARHLLADLVDRGLDTEQGVLVVLDGGKALRAAVREVLGPVPVHSVVRRGLSDPPRAAGGGGRPEPRGARRSQGVNSRPWPKGQFGPWLTTRKRLEFDHIVPVSKGGSNTERNIELLCESCNRRKGASV
jgi:hypothetical protein